MNSRFAPFNFIFLFAAAFLLLSGCVTDKAPPKSKEQKAKEKQEKKEQSVIELHLETSPSVSGSNVIPIYRQNPSYLAVDPNAFLNSGSLVKAAVVDQLDGFVIQLQFDSHGTFVLDTVTTANKSKRIAILVIFPEKRWIAAPLINQRNSSGVLTFTPDATREEAERIVRGLNNVTAQLRKK